MKIPLSKTNIFKKHKINNSDLSFDATIVNMYLEQSSSLF